MKIFGRWLLQRPVRFLELCSATILLLAAVFFADTFGTSVFMYVLSALLFILLLKAFIDGDRLH